MAGSILWKETAVITLTSTLAALVQNGGGIANGTANLDVRAAGNAAGCFSAVFQILVQWVTVTGIVAGTNVGDFYLLPSLDGTNYPDVSVANSSTDYISPNHYVGSFIAASSPITNTNLLLVTPQIDLLPLIYKPYIINRSGQTMTANAVVKVVPASAQYT